MTYGLGLVLLNTSAYSIIVLTEHIYGIFWIGFKILVSQTYIKTLMSHSVLTTDVSGITFIRYTYFKRLENKLIKMSLEANNPKALYSISTICLMGGQPLIACRSYYLSWLWLKKIWIIFFLDIHTKNTLKISKA